MSRTTPKAEIALLGTAIALLAAAPAAAEEVVPPENSAVNQYTETFPTAGGDKDVHKGGSGKSRSPGKVLGSDNASKLEQHGRAGREVAEVAAETAPAEEPKPAPVGQQESDSAAGAPAAGGDGGGNPGGRSEPPAEAKHPSEPAAAPQARFEEPSGSSGIGEILAQATGSTSSGEMGLLLPLLIGAAIAWAIAYLTRRTRRAAQ